MSEPLWVVRAGTVGYRRAWAWQRALVARRMAGEIPDVVLLLEHPHVYTIGKRGKDDDVLASPQALADASAEVVHTDRGGQVTYHGPGQLVGYPITLLPRAPDLLRWVGRVQDALIGIAAAWGVTASAERGDRTGIWVDDPGGGPAAKLAAIGMRVSRRVTSHGFAFNCDTDLTRFGAIVPCGMPDAPVCSLTTLTGARVTVADVLGVAERELGRALEREPVAVEAATLALPALDHDPEGAVAAASAPDR
jgi:lipoyl(octanoyl) transferase